MKTEHKAYLIAGLTTVLLNWEHLKYLACLLTPLVVYCICIQCVDSYRAFQGFLERNRHHDV
jgi:hypothetical protein